MALLWQGRGERKGEGGREREGRWEREREREREGGWRQGERVREKRERKGGRESARVFHVFVSVLVLCVGVGGWVGVGV